VNRIELRRSGLRNVLEAAAERVVAEADEAVVRPPTSDVAEAVAFV